MSEDILHALRIALAAGLATDLSINRMAEEIVETIGIPAATLVQLRAGTHVVVPRELLRDALRDLCSPFPREVQVVAALKMGDTSIERLQALLTTTQEPQQQAMQHN